MISAINEVFELSESTGNARLVLIALANYADQDGVSWPSVGTIAKLANISPRTVQRQLTKLMSIRELAVFRRGNKSGGNLSNYYLLMVREEPLRFQQVCRERLGMTHEEARAALSAYLFGQPIWVASDVTMKAPADSHPGDKLTPAGDSVVTRGVTALSPDPSTDPPVKRKEKKADPVLAGMVNALVDSTGMSGHLNWYVLSVLAEDLIGAGYTQDQVAQAYGPAGWWTQIDWRGKKGQKPTPKQVKETILAASQWDGKIPGKKNGAAPAKDWQQKYDIDGFFQDVTA